ncbi:hypothetical protein OK016_18115 [Vibrio chagasii]|nr:hypothetical protein [Vibrio chagasii]
MIFREEIDRETFVVKYHAMVSGTHPCCRHQEQKLKTKLPTHAEADKSTYQDGGKQTTHFKVVDFDSSR